MFMSAYKRRIKFMLNVIKMDLYKMFKMKSFYVVTIIAMAFGIIMAMNLMPETSDSNTSSNKTMVESTDKNSASDSEDNSEVKIGVQIDTTGIKNTTPNAVYVYGKLLSSGIYLLFSVIFVMIFVSSENKNGYIKNIGGQVRHRRQLFISKMAVIGIYTVLFDLIMFLVEAVVWMICTKKISLGAGCFDGYISFIVFQVLLQYAFLMVCATIEAVIKNRVFGMTAAVCLSIGVGPFICMAIDVGVHKLTGFTVEIEKYLITTKINSLVPSESMSQLLSLTMFVIVYLVIAAAAGIISTEKRDMV